jgi:hypothetical protein
MSWVTYYLLLPLCNTLTAFAGNIGGYAVAIDIDNEVLYTLPALGKAGWESMTLAGEKLNNKNKIVAVIGDDQVYCILLMNSYTELHWLHLSFVRTAVMTCR